MTWADLARKHVKQWVGEVLDLIIKLEEQEINPGKVLRANPGAGRVMMGDPTRFTD